MTPEDQRKWAERAAAWAQTYRETLPQRPVSPDVAPGQIAQKLPPHAPETAEPMEAIFADFETLIPEAMTHWQHPRFFAYFPANASPASQLAEQLTSTLAAQCMLWQTAPAATELEQVMITWLRTALGLAPHFSGTIHDSATTATLCAILTMRDRALDWQSVATGLSGAPRLRIYASAQAHSSIDKAVRLAGIGQDNLVKVPTGPDLGMDAQALAAAIRADRAAGFVPAGLVLSTGGTSVGAMDPVAACATIAKQEGLYTHLDAAWAGSAMICPEFRPLWDGVDRVDSVVFNPHKWLGVQFDCAIQFLADPAPQIRSLGLRPDYLETYGHDDITNFNEWTVPLGRRFRALKIWFALRAYGLEGLRERIRNHVKWTGELCEMLRAHPHISITTEPRLALFTFRYHPPGADPDAATAALLTRINQSGRAYLTQTRHDGAFVIRMTAGSFDCTRADVLSVHDTVTALMDPPATLQGEDP